MMLIVSIACVIGFTAIIYVDNDLTLALGYLGASVVGTVLGGFAGLYLIPVQDQFAIIFGAFGGGVVLCIAVRLARRHWPGP
ncbi:MAG: hypothetical protein ACI8R4_002776 [Paracoccaceae bacterium]|jgi:hypothetical protein